MSDDSIEDGIEQIYSGFQTIYEEGGYRERVEALQALDQMTWFDNFGEPLYRQRLYVASELAESVQDDDVPEFIAEELDGYE